MKQIKINFSIPVGTYLKLGYRPVGSEDPWTFVTDQIAYNQTPYTLTVSADYMYEIYTATFCGSCRDGISDVTVAYEPMS